MTIITRIESMAMSKWCQLHDIHYVNDSGYPNTYNSAKKCKVFAPNGVLLHVPRDSIVESAREFNGEGCLVVQSRCYICWQGESIETIEAVLPFIRQHPQIHELYLIKCRSEDEQAAIDLRRGLRND